MPFAATWMELEVIILSEVSQAEKDKYHMILYMDSKKKKKSDTNELIYKREIDSDIGNKLVVTKGDSGRGGGDKLGVWD